jgi:hypothetical protein
MTDLSKHNRQSIRLRGYDYTKSGGYFITICTQQKENLLGNIHNGQLILNEVGLMVEKWWQKLPMNFPGD